MEKFWETKKLVDLNSHEWEQLCDGCGKCCVHKLQDDETEDVFFTSVACDLFDPMTCKCSDYSNRINKVSMCIQVSLETPNVFEWLPKSCAYKVLNDGGKLPSWHHLITGDRETIHEKNESVLGKVILESDLDEDESLEDYIF